MSQHERLIKVLAGFSARHYIDASRLLALERMELSMRLIAPSLLLFVCLLQAACVGKLQSQPPPKWTVGFWFWEGYSAEALLQTYVPDALFVHAGDIRPAGRPGQKEIWNVYGEIPNHLPKANEYWLVFRDDEQGVPGPDAVSALRAQLPGLLDDARSRDLKVAGIQLDIDSPTGSLHDYAEFLHEVHKTLPPGVRLSITCLLDWFRDGTSVADVIREVDEFVPQFYDVDRGGTSAIAAKFDGARWGPIFNRFGKRFRIGISTFGRARTIAATQTGVMGLAAMFYADLSPLDLSANPAFHLQAEKDDSGETVLSFRATQKVRAGWQDVEPGTVIQFVVPTAEEVRSAVVSAQRMHGQCEGVVFFRWPSDRESLVMQPDDVMKAAGWASGTPKKPDIHLIDGYCAAVKCADVYLINAPVLSPRPVHYRLKASTEPDYFLPEKGMPVRMTGPSELEVSLPPYGGRYRMLLGRVVSATGVTFSLEEEP